MGGISFVKCATCADFFGAVVVRSAGAQLPSPGQTLLEPQCYCEPARRAIADDRIFHEEALSPDRGDQCGHRCDLHQSCWSRKSFEDLEQLSVGALAMRAVDFGPPLPRRLAQPVDERHVLLGGGFKPRPQAH
jgi:hypothetical protein